MNIIFTVSVDIPIILNCEININRPTIREVLTNAKYATRQ